MNRQPSEEAKATLRALRRAAKSALELGLRTGTPVYVVRNGKIVDLTQQRRSSTKPKSTKSNSKRSSRKRAD